MAPGSSFEPRTARASRRRTWNGCSTVSPNRRSSLSAAPETSWLSAARVNRLPRPMREKNPVTHEEKLAAIRDVARGEGNLLRPIRAALAANASIGEVCGSMRDVFGEYKGGAFF
ncbi:MAG TPA: methylmalonyl-CoA mutase family protein [Solirubrobacterales bacterium]|nr:methylmalonyl-CoA mutase family protein [Solirubrobacterales bacterium]